MATIGTDRMIVRGQQRADQSWLFTICYTAHFADQDLGRQFDDAIQIREIHRRGEQPHPYGPPVSFRATGHAVFRKKRVIVRGDDYDTETGLDAVCAWIRLHHYAGTDVVDDEQHTPALVPVGGVQRAVCRRAAVQSLRC
jgi:hypothetical protein